MKKDDTQDVLLSEAEETVSAAEKMNMKVCRRFLAKMIRSVWFWLILLCPLSFVLTGIMKHYPEAAEFYWRYIYRYISVFGNNLTGWLPFSLAEILLVILSVSVILYLIFSVTAVIRRKGKRLTVLMMALVRLIAAGCVVFFLFVLNCGLNYYSPDVSTLTGWEKIQPTTQQLYEVCMHLANQASYYRKKLPENADGTLFVDISGTAQKAKDAVNGLHRTCSFVPDGYSAPKSVILSRGMSFLKVTGVYFPWTFEANVNTNVPGISIPFTMCHELMHVRGFMHEEDANFLAYLACIDSGDDILRYAGYTTALEYLARYLRRADNGLYKEVLAHISEAVQRDMAAESQYWKQFETPIAEAAVKVNDAYLKQNNQSAGVLSYSKMAELVITHYFITRYSR